MANVKQIAINTSAILTFAAAMSVAVVGLSSKAQATERQQEVQNYCGTISGFANAVAQDRDNGVPMESVMAVVPDLHESYQQNAAMIVVYVYQRPWRSPAVEANELFGQCLDTLGGL